MNLVRAKLCHLQRKSVTFCPLSMLYVCLIVWTKGKPSASTAAVWSIGADEMDEDLVCVCEFIVMSAHTQSRMI